MRKSLPLIATVVAGGLVLAACGSDSDNASTNSPADTGTTDTGTADTGAAGGDSSAAAGGDSSAAPAGSGAAGSDAAGSGASGGGAPAMPELPATTIKILAPSYMDSSEADWKKIIDAFKAKQPNVTVELQIAPWDNFTSVVQSRIQANDMPDILNDNNYGVAADGLLYPIDEVTSPETLKSIEPSLLKNGVGADGKQWAAPDIATSRLLIYNTDLFKQAGITAPPKTWDEMYSAAEKISKLGNGIAGYGMPLGTEEAQAESTVWVWGAGGDWVTDGKLNADTPAVAAGFDEMKKFIDGKVTQPNVGSSNRQDVADLFNQGKIGMYVGHSGLTQVTREKFPNIKFDVAPIPSKSGEPLSYGVTDFILAFNNKDDNRKQATKAFLDFFYTQDQYTPWYKGTGLLPVTTEAIAAATKDDAVNAPFYEALKTVRFTPSGDPDWSKLQSALQSTAGKIADQPAADVLKQIQAQAQAGG